MDALRSFLIKSDRPLGKAGARLEKASFFLGSVYVVVAFALVWASFFEIDRVVRVEGRIIPTGRSHPLQHLEGGIISAIHVAEGSLVKKGDVLLSIDSTSADATLNDNKIKLASQRARAARLRAEASLAPTITFPKDLDDDLISAETKLFQARKNKRDSELSVHRQTALEHKAALVENERQALSFNEEHVVAAKRVALLESMAARKAASQIELLEAQSREKKIQTDIQLVSAARPRIQAALAAEQARLASLDAEYKTTAQNELIETLAEIKRLEQSLTTAQDRANRTDIRAPSDGTINRLGATTVGTVVKPGDNVIELTPLSSEILAEAHIPPQDRGELSPQMKAKIRISAYDSAALGVALGFVREISADTMQDPKGNAYYRATIVLSSFPESYKNKPILPGMTVTGDLVVGRRTIMAHLLSPLKKFTSNIFRESR